MDNEYYNRNKVVYRRGKQLHDPVSDLYRKVLNDWYGTERSSVEMASHSPKTIHIKALLEDVAKQAVSWQTSLLIKLQNNWEKIVGKQIANIASPVAIRYHVVYIEVTHSAWLNELSGEIKDKILHNVIKVCGEKNCDDIKFVPQGRRFKN
ncbi:DUF721 domain-containing protein [Lentisphaerota bacterium WC36G]|nr:DUF721 domain-containing protein [Lentisphaerae bacterium WC36]